MTTINAVANRFLWYEKYRPRKLEDLILPDSYRQRFSDYINSGEIPHLLFDGPPGTGKTTVSWILINELISHESDVLYINGSSKKDRSVSNIDEIATVFLSACSMESNIKILFIDEFDGLKIDAQRALRNIIEKYAATNRFITTCNDYNQLTPAIKSRFTRYVFKPLDTKLILERMKYILDSEKILYKAEDVEQLVNIFKPDLRTIINTAEKLVVVKGDKKTLMFTKDDLFGLDDCEKTLVNIINQMLNQPKGSPVFMKMLSKVVAFMNDKSINYKLVLTYLFENETKFQRKYIWGKHLNQIRNAVSEKARIFEAIWESANGI